MLLQSPGIALHQGQDQGQNQGQSLSLTPALRRQLGLLTLDAGALGQHLAQVFGDRDDLLLIPSQAHCIERLFPARRAPRLADAGNGLAAQIAVAPSAALHEDAARQIGLLVRDPRQRRLALLLAEHLAPTGWLDTGLAGIAQQAADAPEAELAAVLRLVQEGIEPAGLFARDLAECLRLQAREAGLLDAVMELVLGNLPLLARGDLPALARLAGTEPERIAACLRAIRGFDPKPGLRFGSDPAPLPEPDLILAPSRNGWLARLNPRLELSVTALRPSGERAAAEIRALTGFRDSTLLRAGDWLLSEQPDWLEQGIAGLRPMTRRQMAEGLGLHETTIGRALRSRSVQTPRGMFALDRLFGAAPARRQTAAGAGTAPQAVLLRLAGLIAQEPPQAPLGDAALAGLLAAEGIPMARRTVAKYRALLRIPPAHARRS